MAADDAGEKTEQPTARRLQEARERGQVPRSTDLTASLSLLAALLLLNALGPQMLDSLMNMVREIGRASDVTSGSLPVWIGRMIKAAVGMVLPFVLTLTVVTVAGGILQSGMVLAWSKLTPKLDKLSPITGFKRLFALDSLTRVGMGILKIALVATIAYFGVLAEIELVLTAGALAPIEAFDLACQLVFKLALRIALVLLVLGLLDFLYQRWNVTRNLKMTKQEVKDELKRMEGDPQAKQRRRQLQLKLAMQRIGIDVPNADVVVTNPTEFAVALKYDEATMAAPRVTAKGQDLLALRIRQVAQQHGIPIVQRPPLARALYASAEIGRDVPAEFYRAVAEVLAYVYQLSGRAAGAARQAV